MGSELVGVLGAGLMGHGIAQVFATAGHGVKLVDADPNALEKARSKIGRNLALLVKAGRLDEAMAARIPDRITCRTDLASVASCDLVVESVTEDASVKNNLFRSLASHLGPDTILTTNTSSIPLSVMAEATGRPDRFCTSHFFRPAFVIPMVEVTKGAQTSEATIEMVMRLLQAADLRPVRINVDLPGQVANRLRQALFREALDLVDRGVISMQDIDELAAFAVGARMPLLGVIRDRDLVGLEITESGADFVWPDLSPAREPHERLRRLVAAGHLGLKSERGFYDWSEVEFADYWEELEHRQIQIMELLRSMRVLPE